MQTNYDAVSAERVSEESGMQARGQAPITNRRPEPIVGTKPRAGTLRPIELDLTEYRDLSFDVFVDRLFAEIRWLKDERFGWYDEQRRKRSKWANGSRKLLSGLGAIAILLTALASAFRIYHGSTPPSPPLDLWALVGALILYALMGAISFYEKATDSASAYFRHLGIALAIRDLWTKLEFEFLKEVLHTKVGDAAAEMSARERLRALAAAFCSDLDKLASGELAEWHTEFLASLSELEATATKGSDEIQNRLQDAIKDYENAAAAARAAAKAAEDAARPAIMNLVIDGEFDDEVIILVDDKEVARTHLKSFPVDRLLPGYAKIQARAKRASRSLEAAVMVDLKPGLQQVRISLG